MVEVVVHTCFRHYHHRVMHDNGDWRGGGRDQSKQLALGSRKRGGGSGAEMYDPHVSVLCAVLDMTLECLLNVFSWDMY